MNRLTIDVLARAVSRDGAAIRCRTRLQPVGGKGDKVFPPTYGETSGKTAYSEEVRRVDGEDTPVVLLDSVASQANRLEEALRLGWEYGELKFPVIHVDFTTVEGLEDLDQITVLDAPHRIADALLRDSLWKGKAFRASPAGESMTISRPGSASPLYYHCPTALVFGVWDSTGPRGGLGSKFPRALVSEVVAVNARVGVKSASRMDPAAIQRGVEIFQVKGDEKAWTLDPNEAACDKKGKPVLYKAKEGDPGRPSAVNHGNVMPSLDHRAGGITMDYAEQCTVLSLAALRALRFPVDATGAFVDRGMRREVENAARTALAALGLAAMVYGRTHDYFLRSRCDLVPESAVSFEVVGRNGEEPTSYLLDVEGARQLLSEAQAAAAKLGMGWNPEDVKLDPAPKLIELIRLSRALKETD